MRRKTMSWSAASLAVLAVLLSQTAAADIKVLDSRYKPAQLVKDTPFGGANGATIAADGALYVVHTGDGTTTRIDLKTMRTRRFIPAYAGTYITDDITSDDKGNLYITGTTPVVGEVYRIDKNGVKTVIARGLTAPNGIQYNKRTGRLFVTECFQANRIFEVDPTGAKEPRLLVKENVIPVPEGFGFDPDTNDLIVPDLGTGRVLRVHPDSGEITTIAEKFAAPVALKVGPDKMAYIVEIPGGVYRLSLDGQKREKLAQLPAGLDNLALTPEGRFFVTSYWNATVYEVATDGSGKFKTLFPTGSNAINGVVWKNGKLWISDAIMIRGVDKGAYVPTKLNAWAGTHMPLPIGLADGPGDQLLWPDFVNGAVALGDPVKGEFKAVAGGLSRPLAVAMSREAPKFYVAEYGAGRVTEVSLTDGAKKTVAEGLEGPMALALVNGTLYVAEGKPSRISKIDPATGNKEVFVSSAVGKVGALADDGSGALLALSGSTGKLFRIDPKNLAVSVVAENLPVGYSAIGSYPPGVEFAGSMGVAANGDVYIATAERGVWVLRKAR
ncbi:MAG: SMP-30/gluconolactonase/LRE family protein [Sulfurifustis sp.]